MLQQLNRMGPAGRGMTTGGRTGRGKYLGRWGGETWHAFDGEVGRKVGKMCAGCFLSAASGPIRSGTAMSISSLALVMDERGSWVMWEKGLG